MCHHVYGDWRVHQDATITEKETFTIPVCIVRPLTIMDAEENITSSIFVDIRKKLRLEYQGQWITVNVK